MAITIPNASVETFSGTAGTSHTMNLSTASAGDVRVIVIGANPDGTGTIPAVNLPSGWTEIGSQLNTGAASDGLLAIFYRVVVGGDGATLGFTTTQACMMHGTATTYVGVDNTTVLDGTVPTFATGSSPPVSPSITTGNANARVCVACNIDGAPTFGDGDIPSGFTLRGTAQNNPPSNGQNMGSADILQATAGASGTKSWTNGGTEEYVAATFALREGPTTTYEFNGITKDSAGSALGSCEVQLWKMNATFDDATFVDSQTSNATTGAYNFTGIGDDDSRYFVIAVKDGTENVMDTTDHILTPTEEP